MLDADGFVTSGWVLDLLLLHQFVGDKFVIKGKVMFTVYFAALTKLFFLQVKHSQRLSYTPLLPWSIVKMEGAHAWLGKFKNV